jgi:hypothetical protein
MVPKSMSWAYLGEQVDDGARMVVNDGLGVPSGSCEGLGRNFAVGFVEGLKNFWDGTFEEASDIVNHVGNDVAIECTVKLLYDDSLDEVACMELVEGCVEGCSLGSDDGGGGACRIGKDWEGWADERVVRGDTSVDRGVDDEA